MESHDAPVTSGNGRGARTDLFVIHDGEGQIHGYTHDESFAEDAANKLCGTYDKLKLLTEIKEVFSVRTHKTGRTIKKQWFDVEVKEEYIENHIGHYVEAGSYDRCFEILREKGVETTGR